MLVPFRAEGQCNVPFTETAKETYKPENSNTYTITHASSEDSDQSVHLHTAQPDLGLRWALFLREADLSLHFSHTEVLLYSS